MKSIGCLAIFLLSTSVFAGWKSETRATLKEYKAECRNTVVSVDEIVKNSHIKGHVKGLPTDAYEKFMVVFYVKTNVWYVHPYEHYEGQEEGYSYSNLNPNGEFYVRTLKRDIPSKELAAVVVPRSYAIRAQRWWLKPLFGIFGGILKFECNHVIVPGNGDFFM
jgi:hypothetical protein